MSQSKFNFMAEKTVSDLKQEKRHDSRKLDEFRQIQIFREISKNADGSARVKLGATDVLCGIKMSPMPPYPDMPDEGTISVMAELLALASPDFEVGPPNDESIELARVVDRCLREGKVIDFKSLLITEGELVWTVFVDLYVLNHDGNLFDASSIAALAALLESRIPKLEENKIVKGEYSKKLKVSSKPLLCTFAKVNSTVFLDPCLEEEKVLDARLSIGVTEDDSLCAMQKGGSGFFTSEEVFETIDLTFKNAKLIRKLF